MQRDLKAAVRAIIVHHQLGVAEALADALERRLIGLTVVAVASDLAFLKSTDAQADLVLIEDGFPNGMGRSQGVAVARRRWPDSVVIAVGESDSSFDSSIAISAGATGWANLSDTMANLAELLHWAMVKDNELTRMQLRGAAGELGPLIYPAAIARSQVTTRERDVLRHAQPPVRVAKVAHALGLSQSRVETHLRHLTHLLGVDRDLLYERAMDFGVITDEE